MMKLKSNQTRTYDGEGYKKRAACLCFRSESEEEVLLVSSSRHPDKWIVPGGGMEPEEEPNVAAAREVCEEAGVKGTLGRLVGIFENKERKHRTYVYVLIVTEVLEDWEDSVNIGKNTVCLLFKTGITRLKFSCSHMPGCGFAAVVFLTKRFKNLAVSRILNSCPCDFFFFFFFFGLIISARCPCLRSRIVACLLRQLPSPPVFSVLSTGRKREWFKIDDAIQVLRCHKPVQATYFEALQESFLTSNGTPLVTTIGGDLSPTYSINQSSVSGIR
uniref:diphosphoinositol-polyphosphate diphosphatase n=1 Tax=Fundulus heteroclitus TaxID=8078 RepID=A0A3Q2TGI7_FUNHE